jgi:hypothetical protein
LFFGAIIIGRLFEDEFLMVTVFISASMVLSNLIMIHYSRQACFSYRDN